MECCFCKELASGCDNQYYIELGKEIGVESRILIETDNWFAVPTMGCLTQGYVLLVCKQHFLCMASLSGQLYQEMLELKGEIESILLKKLGLHCVAFEHGATRPGCGGANSVEHMHLHLVPFPQIIWPNMVKKNNLAGFCAVAGYQELFNNWKRRIPETYLIFQDIDKTIYYKEDGAESQFFRKCLVPYFNEVQWDWRREYYRNNFLETLELFR